MVLFFVWTNLLFSRCRRSNPFILLIELCEVIGIVTAHLAGDFRYGIICLQQQALSLIYPAQVDVIDEGAPSQLFEGFAKMIRVEIYEFRREFNADLLVIVAVQILQQRLETFTVN